MVLKIFKYEQNNIPLFLISFVNDGPLYYKLLALISVEEFCKMQKMEETNLFVSAINEHQDHTEMQISE
jgi:hypothetical protein